MPYELGVLGGGAKREIKSIRTLSDDEFRAYQDAISHLSDFSSDQQRYTITLLNYENFLNVIIRYSNEYKKNPAMVNYPILEKVLLDINRHLINYLFSVRAFLDHTEYKLIKTYGGDSAKARNFKTACSLEYDNNFAYRFLYRLRNYSQHCSLPISELKFTSKEEPPFSGNIVSMLILKFNRNTLLSYNGWGSTVEREIRALPEEFNVVPLVASFWKSLEAINQTLINDNLAELVQSAQYVEKLINEVKGKDRTPIIFTLTRNNKISNVNILNIPFHLIEYVKALKGKSSV